MRQRKSRANGPVRKRKKWPWLVTAGIIVALVGAMAVPAIRNGPIGQVVGRTIAPLQEAYANIEGQVRDWFTMMDQNNTLLQENQTMKAENDEIATLRQQLEELKQENQRLRGLERAADSIDNMEFMQATIIAKSPESWYSTVVINRGSQDGVEKDMAVITGDGLLGRVISVSDTHSQVLTILDGRSALSVMVERTRDNGVLKGQMLLGSEESYCRLLYLQDDSDLVPGDRIVTTQLDGLLPRGLVVGEVVEVARTEGDERYALVKPSADISRAEDVLVVLTRPESAGITIDE